MTKMIDHALDKTANVISSFLTSKELTAGMGNTAKMLTAGGIAAYGVSQLMTKLQNDTRRKALIDDLISNDPILKSADKQQVMNFYLTIMNVAPSISLDRNIVQELLQNFVKFGRVDINTIKTLTDIEKSHNTGTAPSFLSKFM